jgi:hypothetical protein
MKIVKENATSVSNSTVKKLVLIPCLATQRASFGLKGLTGSSPSSQASSFLIPFELHDSPQFTGAFSILINYTICKVEWNLIHMKMIRVYMLTRQLHCDSSSQFGTVHFNSGRIKQEQVKQHLRCSLVVHEYLHLVKLNYCTNPKTRRREHRLSIYQNDRKTHDMKINLHESSLFVMTISS